jgi:hypothetical protein
MLVAGNSFGQFVRRRFAMEAGLDHGLSRGNETRGAEASLVETLSHVEHDLNDVIAALALLGVKRCCQCKQFFRSSEPGTLFDYGQLVCYECVSMWWPKLSAQLNVVEREKIEGKLSPWLRKYHRAEVVKEIPGKVSDTTNAEFQIVAKCLECSGSGKLMEGERCRFCNGFGTVRIVVPK